MGLQLIALCLQGISLDDENYYHDRHDGLRGTTDNYKSYFLKKSHHRLNSTVMNQNNREKIDVKGARHTTRNSIDADRTRLEIDKKEGNLIKSFALKMYGK